jgi:hypothetical protein
MTCLSGDNGLLDTGPHLEKSMRSGADFAAAGAAGRVWIASLWSR